MNRSKNSCSSCGNTSPCNRGERIMVNSSSRSSNPRSRCSCENTWHNSCDCRDHHREECDRDDHEKKENCGCQRPRPPKPCPSRPSCEDRCRSQYRQCMKSCREREERSGNEDDFEEERRNQNEWDFEERE